MEELPVPTRRVAVELFMSGGAHARGTIFLTEGRHRSDGPEVIAELLNDDRAFVPFRADDPRIDAWIVNKHHVMRVHLRDCDTPQPDAVPACTLVLCDRSRLTGRLLFDAPVSASRLVDKLNRAPSFMTFVRRCGAKY